MTAETFTAVVREPSGFSTEKKKRGADALDATALTALGALTTGATASDVLDILSANQKRAHVVAAGQIGKATSTLN
jgi:hypothetical protein